MPIGRHERGSVRRLCLGGLLAAYAAIAVVGCGGSALEVRRAQPQKSPIDSTVVVDCGGYAQVAPVELVVGCRYGGRILRALKWRGWGHERAAAVGRLTRDCARCDGTQARAVRVEVVGRVLRRDATLAYRTLTVTPAVKRAGERPLRYQIYDGYLEVADRQPSPEAG
ncbi:hypothetical protein [Conexibacter woesei]|uniref:Lipoprotein n=1 Tax=Conexibacter woesei (strain DSM 14684 / CCUG 47730 / CIP 108061 / JCM 11494 / NBRC 100937 / ID131577) TaxID=469383 RepID=D3FDF8_CONWI|nr:hypothetical protein [Conexibacter woesei]ADB53550.1 hypothetical protein Cwoe_5141 [Conexibacter woesei DSM 14684]